MTAKFCKPAPKTLKAWIDKHPDRVAEFDCGYGYSFGGDNDFGYDILLAPGWRMDDDYVHTLIEPTVADMLKRLRSIVRCDCAECKELLTKQEESCSPNS
jgi:hypothetical protein